mmetsp:Transcript_52153/g.167063  ORF Transcript_52153/g.167063 Transcript_52153/m.167063 type:complete len:218 (+) Transcript_52153:551-1204(+)
MSCACLQVPRIRCSAHAAVLCITPTGCVRSKARTRSPRERQPTRCSKTRTSQGCCSGRRPAQRKPARGKTAWRSSARPGTSRRRRSASRASLRCSPRGLVHLTRRPACAAMKTWFRPPLRTSLAPATSAWPKSLRSPSSPNACSSAAGTSPSSARATSPGSPCTGNAGQARPVSASRTLGGGLQHVQSGTSCTTCPKSKLTLKHPEAGERPASDGAP